MGKEFIGWLLSTSYIPHGHCYLWQTPLVLLNITGDALIALAYFSISITLIYFIRKRKDIPFKNVFLLFSAFILSCATTHIMEIVTLWYPLYWISSTIKAITALISMLTAVELFPLIPKALALPSPSYLEALNQEISQLNTELEQRVQDRTYDLEVINEELIKRNQEMNQLREISEFLQLCNSLDETKKIIADLLKNLFPEMSGAIYLMNESQEILENVSSWGIFQTESIFFKEDCWALRKGDFHIVHPDSSNLYCEHFNQETKSQGSLCLPMTARGKIFGLLHLIQTDFEQISQSTLVLAQAITQQLSLSLANLQLQETLQKNSLRDPLTKLFNRRYLEESVKKEIHRAARHQKPIGIMIIDVDNFKNFNDTYGHEAGDFVLIKLSKYLEKNTRNSDIICRYGGEEFLLILPDVSLEQTFIRADMIRKKVKSLNLKYRQKFLEITISIGVACFPDHGLELEDLIAAADQALYSAKNQGRDCTVSR